MRRMENSYS
ncbi:hypothetical protein Tco_0547388, partial [Tanacetum coccineum]